MSFAHAFRGLLCLIRTQHNAWLHFGATVTLLLFGMYAQLSLLNWCWLLTSIGSVWIAEAFNTSLEFLGDAVSSEFNPLIRDGKDIAAGAVLLVAIIATLNILAVFASHFAILTN